MTKLLPLVVLAACAKHSETTETDGWTFSEGQVSRLMRHRFEAIPAVDPTNAVSDDPAAQRLGQYLFFDTGLSGSGEHSCASCHKPEYGFADPDQF